MKKYIIILAAAVCALCACQKHEIELLDKPITEQIDANTYTYTFSAVISDNVSEVEEDGTKATVSRAGAFAWAIDDELKFFKSDNSSANAKITAIDGSTATITVYDVDSRAEFVTAIYPASAAVSKNQISFNARGPIVVADIADGGTLTFHHIGSLINLKFYDISGLTAIKSLVFEPASPFNYDGSFTFDGSNVPSLTLSGTTSKIVVPASSSDNNSDITVVVPSVNLSGFSAALNSESDGSGRNLFKKSTATAHDLATSRPVLMNMKRVAYAAPSKFYVKTVCPHDEYPALNCVRMIQNGSNTYTLSAYSEAASQFYVLDEYNLNNPINGALVSKDLSTSETYQIESSTTLGVRGNVIAPGESDIIGWDEGVEMSKRGTWVYAKNVKFKKEGTDGNGNYCPFAITDGTNWHKGVDVNINSKNSKTSAANYNIYLHKFSEDDYYDVYYNVDGDYEIRVFDTGMNNPLSGLYTVTYNSSTKEMAVSRIDDAAALPFANKDYPINEMAISGSFNDWGYTTTFTYNGNMSWVKEGLEISSPGNYTFKIRKAEITWSFAAGVDSGLGSSLYGTLKGDTDNASVTLEAGTYNVYLNATSDWYYNIMFEKQ